METLPKNLADNPDTDDVQVEFVVLNYGDKTGMHEWMMTDPQIQEEIAAGRIIYARNDKPEVFHMAHAKNMAHRLATGDVVCNLDADNFTGKAFANALSHAFCEDINYIVRPSVDAAKMHNLSDYGYLGRIAISRLNFLELGGYDERYEGWGAEDTNFFQRARFANLNPVQFANMEFLSTISHSDEMRIENSYACERERVKQMQDMQKYQGNILGENTRFGKVINQLSADYELFGKVVRKLSREYTKMSGRAVLLQNALIANQGINFGLGRVSTLDVEGPRDAHIPPLKGVYTKSYNEYSVPNLIGTVNLLKSHLRPHVVTLTNPDAQPS